VPLRERLHARPGLKSNPSGPAPSTMKGGIMDWRDDSACREVDPDLFFPDGKNAPARTQIEKAKQICLSCPVVQPCLHFAVSTGQLGVWGGLDDDERRKLRRRKAAA
jgi:WhiB family redox-sensing transcriptional regulator